VNAPPTPQHAATATPAVENKTPPTEAASGEDSSKRFSKKYPS